MDIDTSQFYGAWSTFLAPIIFFLDNLLLLVCDIIKPITGETVGVAAAIELILGLVFYTIQNIKKPDGYVLLLLYKGLGITFLIHLLMAPILILKTTINPANMLLIVMFIAFSLWALFLFLISK